VLIAEACSHHAQDDDIGRVKIPRLLARAAMEADMAGTDVSLLTKLDQVVTDLGFGKYTTTTAGSTLNMFVYTLSLMIGTAGLPHVIMRFFTVPTVSDARISAGWALVFIAILYTTAPAVGAMAKLNLHGTVNTAVGLQTAADGSMVVNADAVKANADVFATEASLVAFLPAAQAISLIYSHALVAERVMKRLAQKIRAASSHRSILGMPNAHQRVFALLAQLVKIAPGGLAVIENIPTQQEIAIMVNTSRETVSRALQVLIQSGVVEKDLRRLIVRQPEQLKAMILESEKNAS
jgi:Na+(H+)/acetate symporter ActP